MIDISNMNCEELIDLKNKIELSIAEKTKNDSSFYSKIINLKVT